MVMISYVCYMFVLLHYDACMYTNIAFFITLIVMSMNFHVPAYL